MPGRNRSRSDQSQQPCGQAAPPSSLWPDNRSPRTISSLLAYLPLNLPALSSARPFGPPIAQPVWNRDEREYLDFVNKPAANAEGLHGHQMLQHARRRVRRSAAPGAVVNEQRKRSNQTLLFIDNQRPSRPYVFHVCKRLAVDLLRARHHAELELGSSLLRVRVRNHRRGHHSPSRWRIVHRLIAVFMAYAVLGERRDLAVVSLEGVEIRVGRANQNLARAPLRRGNVVDQRFPRRGEQRNCSLIDVAIP